MKISVLKFLIVSLSLFGQRQVFCELMNVATRAEDMMNEFQLVGSVRSDLFASCFEGSLMVEGELFSVEIEEGKRYDRFEVIGSSNITWTDVEMSGEPNIMQCALKATEQQAMMFKVDGNCQVSLTDKYPDEELQGCDGAEVIFKLWEEEAEAEAGGRIAV
ncbi:hypothetical protein FHG87_004207 [Trinorchestia longiramus]|nr:hypothetical protein FHG87_004207 [Trinorchestia longiramus]